MESESGTPRPGSSHQPDALQTGKDFPFGLLPMQMCEDSGSDISGTEHLLLIGKHAQHRAAGSQPRALSAPWEPEPGIQSRGTPLTPRMGNLKSEENRGPRNLLHLMAEEPGNKRLSCLGFQSCSELTCQDISSANQRENRKRQTGGSFTQHKQLRTFHLLPVYSPERSLFVIPHQKDSALQGSGPQVSDSETAKQARARRPGLGYPEVTSTCGHSKKPGAAASPGIKLHSQMKSSETRTKPGIKVPESSLLM
ncbi:hypothetical protein MJG53_009328 [Ovis ammon polii x Ovis aries]|uniref:Uncharacterized protein n=1 Tax=Ovis ammon polii x Ovis aries TaxID=2918886 RepID=A0ACB9UWC5_9CETA|nr:hypothetical protein MJG53_009328 [Ovis ammon polii x Ovis aries]